MALAATSHSSRGRMISSHLRANSWSKDGKHLLFSEVSPSRSANQCAIGQLDIERPSEAHVLVKSDACNDWPAVSPGGNWMAVRVEFVRSGNSRSYIERYPPELGKRHHRSRRAAAGSRSGRVTVVSCSSSARTVGRSMRVGGGRARRVGRRRASGYVVRSSPCRRLGAGSADHYDVAPDGRFVMIGAAGETRLPAAPRRRHPDWPEDPKHWFEELKRLRADQLMPFLISPAPHIGPYRDRPARWAPAEWARCIGLATRS